MALVLATLAAAMDSKSPLVSLSAITSLVAGMYGLVDGEFVGPFNTTPTSTLTTLPRGQIGSAGAAHASGANITFGLAADFAAPPAGAGSAYGPNMPWTQASYSAAGAIALPVGKSGVNAVINGTSALAMTVAAPTTDQDGAMLIISGNGAAQHTVQFTGGLSLAGGSYDVLTFNATTKPITVTAVAVNGAWQVSVAPAITGTVTSITGGIG